MKLRAVEILAFDLEWNLLTNRVEQVAFYSKFGASIIIRIKSHSSAPPHERVLFNRSKLEIYDKLVQLREFLIKMQTCSSVRPNAFSVLLLCVLDI